VEKELNPYFLNQSTPAMVTDDLPALDHQAALVIDLPGPDGIWIGLALAGRGFRPVPLFNAIPDPRTPMPSSLNTNATAVVDVNPILAALQTAALPLQNLTLAPNAPPAFLLDANRRGAGQALTPGRFDNRSISFTTDFPSATFLAARGIRQAVLIQASTDHPQPDLAHTLRRWQDAGISIVSKRLDSPGAPVPIVVEKPSTFGRLWQRALAVMGLRRYGLGGFGGVIPIPSAG
jgi:hypothetical protein